MSAIPVSNDVKQNGDPLITIRGLRTVLNGKTIFDDVDLDIPRGGITAIMGPSGTGKTTLMRHITGQLAPDAGTILVDGLDVGRIDRDALFALREKIGYLFQNSALLTDYSVFENVAFPLRQHMKLPEEILRNIVLTKLQAVGLRGAADAMDRNVGGVARGVVAYHDLEAVVDADAAVVDRNAADRQQRVAVRVEARGLRVDDDPASHRPGSARSEAEPARHIGEGGDCACGQEAARVSMSLRAPNLR